MESITIKDVAHAAGVSTATVSRVLNKNGYVSLGVRQHVEQVMKDLNYQPNVLARSLKKERSKAVGIILPDMTNAYFMKAARRVQQLLLDRDFHLIYMDSGEDPVKELEAIQLLQGMRIEALILAGTGQNSEILSHLMHSGISVVLLDRYIDGINSDIVVEDNIAASDEAVTYLIEKYGSSIGVISGPEGISTARERLEGVRRALKRKGMRFPDEMYFGGDYTRKSGVDACSYFMSMAMPPAAVFSCNNEMTYGFYLALKEKGIALDAIEVVSFGELDAAPLFNHRLSVINQNPERIGEAVAELTLKWVEHKNKDKEKRIFTPRFEKLF